MAMTYYGPSFHPHAPEDETTGGPVASVMDDGRFDDRGT